MVEAVKIHIVVVDDDGRDAAADVVVAVCDEHLTSHCLRFFWMVSDVDFDDASWSKMILIQELRLVLHVSPFAEQIDWVDEHEVFRLVPSVVSAPDSDETKRPPRLQDLERMTES